MANKEDRYSDNQPGKYYVDTDCIGCDTCFAMAKNHFKLVGNYDHAIVSKQPETAAETEDCELAVHACPVGAIGNDGDA